MNVTDLLEGPDRSAPPRRKWRRLLIAGLTVLTLAALGIVARFSQPSTGQQGADNPALARQEARAALAAFLAAATTEDRATRVMDGDKLLPLMQAHYTAREATTLSADDFRDPSWTFSAPAPGLIALECPRDRGLPPVVACFKKCDGGPWLLDWEIWTQSLAGEFRNFIHKPSEGEHTLRARLTRTGSGEDMTITVADPFDTAQTINFDRLRPDLRLLYERDLPAAGTRTATIQLVWLNDSLTGTLTPALRRHLCWGFPGLDGQEPAPVEVNLPSRHRPPPGIPAVPQTPPPAVLAAAPVIEDAITSAVRPSSTGALTGHQPAAASVLETAKK